MNQGEALSMITSVAQIESRMFLIRGHCERVELKVPGTRRRPPCGEKVMLSQHLAELYEVEPAHLKSQFVTSSWGGK
jgi:hypothetical protein